jgi:predicted LPLAT superfamily acyltransferase
MSTPGDRIDAPQPGSRRGDWTAQRERSHLWVLRGMRWIAVHAGRRLARGVLHPITLYYLLVNHTARRASVHYLGRALGRPAGWADVYRHIHRFAATILDRVYFLQARADQFEICSSGAEAVHRHLGAEGGGAMLVGAHLGSFEALRSTAGANRLPVAMLMYEDNARLINATLAALAPQVKLQTIALGRPGAMLALRRWLDDGGLAGLLADRTLPGLAPQAQRSHRSRIVRLPFLGRPAPFSDGPFRLAALLRRPVYFMVGLYHGGNRYEVRFVQLADFRNAPSPTCPTDPADSEARILAAMQAYVALLESLCRESPFNWFNFFDFWADDGAAS